MTEDLKGPEMTGYGDARDARKAPEACSPLGSIALRFQELEATASNVAVAVEIITERLNVLLAHPAPKADEGDDKPKAPVQPECPMADRIRNVSDQLRETTDTLNDVIGRLEL